MPGLDLKRDRYTIGSSSATGAGGDPNSMVCSDGSGNALFKVTWNPQSAGDYQFTSIDGKAIGQIKRNQQSQAADIYDSSGSLVGSASLQQQGRAVLTDASGKALAAAMKDGGSNSLNVTSPDGSSYIASVTLETNGQQGGGMQQRQGGFGGISQGMGLMGQGFGMGRQGSQNAQGAQRRLIISVQSQTLKPLLLLSFAFSLPKLLGQGGNQKQSGMGGLGSMGMAGLAGMLLGGFLGGGLGGLGGSSGGSGRRPRIGRL